LRQELGIPNLIFYSARKSFSQHAFELGISTQVIDYILGHSLRARGVIYHYVSVKPEMATEAIRKVIDNLNKKEGA
jgi:intergrase/recombinase